MHHRKRARIIPLLWVLASVLLFNCRVWTAAPVPTPVPEVVSFLPEPEEPAVTEPALTPTPTSTTTPFFQPISEPVDPPAVIRTGMGNPAGCLSGGVQSAFRDGQEMLAYADSLLDLKRPLTERLLPFSWNMATGSMADDVGVLSLNIKDVHNEYVVQEMLNALQAAGFVAWLRDGPLQGRHILAIPLLDPALLGLDGTSAWAPYVQAYWESPNSHPDFDPHVLPALKLPPCEWMVERGFAPQVEIDWLAAAPADWPDYSSAAEAYLAATSDDAAQVARRIDWLQEGLEGPNTMCGPLAWSILQDAGVFPPGRGGWAEGARSFWLADPPNNGRPWQLFPTESYRLYEFEEPLGLFDFSSFPLYPGDFLFTYSAKDGFDHMLVVTEVDEDGNVYTVTNVIQVVPENKVTVERVLLLNLYDPEVGIARNQWARDGLNGRTGHDGFDVFRWAWAEKDALGQPATYTVQPGDNLDLIALRWRTPAERIARYNGTAVDAALMVGQEVVIPPNETWRR